MALACVLFITECWLDTPKDLKMECWTVHLEHGAGAMFEAEPQLDKMPSTDDDAGDAPEASPEKSSTTRKRPNLKVIK